MLILGDAEWGRGGGPGLVVYSCGEHGPAGSGSWGWGRDTRGGGYINVPLRPARQPRGCLILSGNRASRTLAQAAGLGGDSVFFLRSHRRPGASPGLSLPNPRNGAPPRPASRRCSRAH